MSTQKNSRILFKGGIVVTMDANVPNLATGDVLIEDDRIVGSAPPARFLAQPSS
jgi:5-methylthioadenosine/S-adenosylhomocysteine deaminase